MAITRVQGNKFNSGSLTNSGTITLPSGVTQGNLLVLAIATGDNNTTFTPPDPSWTLAAFNQPAGTSATIGTSIWYMVVDALHAGQRSWTWMLSASHTVYITLEEWHASNGWPTSPVDQTVLGDTAGTPTTATIILSGTTATTTQAEELWVASLAYKGSAQTESAITTGWTRDLEATLSLNNTMTMLYNVAAATGSAACQYTIGSAQYWAGCAVTFKDNLAAPPPPSPVLTTTPSSLTFSATSGGSSPASQSDVLAEIAGTATAWTRAITYTSGSGWLSTSPTSGSLVARGTRSISVSAATGSLAAGTYRATITFTATTGGATATVSVTFVVTPAIATTFSIKLAGQDITNYVDQLSINIDDTLGQGAGAGSSGATQGRASTCKLNTNLGPMNRAIGAGQPIPPGPPSLVRQGELIITDSTGTIIWAGYATKYTDTTTSQIGHTKQNFTAVEGIDYSTSLQRVLINESFSAVTDVFIIQFLMQKYAPWVNLAYLPTTPAYTFPIKNFRNVTLEQALQTIAGVTGYLIYVDYLKFLHYVTPTSSSSAPYNVSDNPDFITTFPAAIPEFLVDDNAAINRVAFYGGSKLSNDFWQDVSGMANGSNLVFVLAFYASPLSTGKYGVMVNGTSYAVGVANGQSASNQFISAGGTAQVLIDPGSKTATFDTGLAPAGGSLVLIGYRYNYPLSLIITDEVSHKFFGMYLDGSIDDNTIFDVPTAIQRCKVLLAQQSFGLTSLKLDIWNRPGVQAGMIIHVTNSVRGINGTYLVQQVTIDPIGGGNFVYHLSLGAWNWNLIDFLLKLPTLATFQDNQTETQEVVTIMQLLNNVTVHDTWTMATRTGPYYARSAPVGDGHDAYPGLSTISS